MAVPEEPGEASGEPQRWQRLKDLFEAARARSGEERAALLVAASASDRELAEEAALLLAAHDKGAAPVDMFARPAGDRIGPYRILSELGRGGMGSVYRAVREDDEFRQQVAVKLVRTGLDSEALRERFRNERLILSRLQHTNIATLRDGGTTTDGRAYLVMELVAGEPIDSYCDRRALATSERLELFRVVCAAVHYAHQNLVVHRDLKPGNILVTADGTPKLLDFGIAKLLRGGVEDAATVTMLPAMTPEYASPEQVRGDVITTASDVYSLGVLLYQILTGRRPYEISTRHPEAIVRAVCETEPERPSSVVRTAIAPSRAASSTGSRASPRELLGDIDTIVMKALRKEPERRYASAQELAEDIRRYLAGLPVLARPDTLRYRTGKFVRRHSAAVLAAALAVLSLLTGTALALQQARVARFERARAERRFADVRQLANSLLFEFHDAIATLPGATKARELVLLKAAEHLDKLAGEAGDDPALRDELVEAYTKLSDVQGGTGQSNLGNQAAALLSSRKAVRLAEPVAQAQPATPAQRLRYAAACRRLSSLLRATGDSPGARAYLERAFGVVEGLAEPDRSSRQAQLLLGGLFYEKGFTQAAASDLAAAKQSYGESVRIFEALLAHEPANASASRSLAVMRKYYGAILQRTGASAQAREQYEKAIEADSRRLEQEPHNPTARLDLSHGYASIANLDAAAGDLDAALKGYRQALLLREAVAKADPADVTAQAAVARTHTAIAGVLAKRRR